MKDTWIVLQARTGSTRLKEKILANICGKPLLFHVVERLKRVKGVSGIVIATTTNPEDEAVVKLARELGVRSCRGSEDDVLERYVQAAKEVGAKIIVRATGDNPLCSPEAIDWALAKHHETDSDYTFVNGLPIGAAFSVVNYDALCRVHQLLDSLNPHREHVTSFIQANPGQFKIEVVEPPPELKRPHLRLTVDTEEDLALIREIYNRLYKPGQIIRLKEAINLLDQEPELTKINTHIRQKAVGE